MVHPLVAEKLRDQEIQNIEQRNGWAIGTVVLIEDGEVKRRIEDAYIELFNGEGRAGVFGGVKFLAEVQDEYEESYAFATRDAFEKSSQTAGWYVEKWSDPASPNYSKPAP